MGFEGRRKGKYEVAGKFIERMKKIQECSDLAQDDLTTLLVWVDKENSMEFLLNFLHYLYNYCMVCALSSHSPYVT